jgi:hypothetical protein
MDEARLVLVRLARIDALRKAGAEPQILLEELRALVCEGESWVAAEGSGAGRAADALDHLSAALARGSDADREGVVAGGAAL